MDRSGQLRNVAFGGSWSEQIAGREALIHALDTLQRAASGAGAQDPRDSLDVGLALDLACRDHPKGEHLRQGWGKAASIAVPGVRIAELKRIATLLRDAQRGRLG